MSLFGAAPDNEAQPLLGYEEVGFLNRGRVGIGVFRGCGGGKREARGVAVWIGLGWASDLCSVEDGCGNVSGGRGYYILKASRRPFRGRRGSRGTGEEGGRAGENVLQSKVSSGADAGIGAVIPCSDEWLV